MLNDPKYDPYAIPTDLLKHARKQMKRGKTREKVASELSDMLNDAAKEHPEIKEHIGLLDLNILMQFIMIQERLKIVDDTCEESAEYTRLLNRIRSRKHEQNNQRELTEKEQEAKRKRHTEYMRKRREDPKMQEKNRVLSREYYQRRRDTDPEAHAAYLEEKRQKRMEDKKDPKKVKRFQAHAKKSLEQRKERYRTDPEYREEQRAQARARHQVSRAKRRQKEDTE